MGKAGKASPVYWEKDNFEKVCQIVPTLEDWAVFRYLDYGRNREIYHKRFVERKSEKVVAAEMGISHYRAKDMIRRFTYDILTRYPREK